MSDAFVGTFAFFNARTGKLTASRMATAMSFKKTGDKGETAARADLRKNILAERMTDIVTQHYVNDAMRWGSDTEDEAVEAYVAATGNEVQECGTFDHYDIDNFAATPDRLVGRDGLLETKCPTTSTHLEWMAAGVVPEEHKPQMIAQIACTGRAWVDFASYDPRIKDPGKRLFIRRFTPTEAEIEAVESAARQLLAEVDAMFDAITATPVAA